MMLSSIYLLSCHIVRRLTVCAFLGLVCGHAVAAVLVDDGFTDGGRTNGTDPLDIAWYTIGAAGSAVGVVSDTVLGSGSALRLTATSYSQGLVGKLPSAVTLNDNESISLSFAYRFTGTLNVNHPGRLRFGLYDSGGTYLASDADGSGRTDDVGYYGQTNPGSSGSAGTSVVRETAGDEIMTGTGTASFGSAGASVSGATSAHVGRLTITRSGSALLFTASIDGQNAATATDGSPVTYTFDEITFSIGLGNFTTPSPLVIDNVQVEHTAPSSSDQETAGPALRLISNSEITAGGLNFATGDYGTCINGQTFQQEALVSYRGYQYAAYFDASRRPAVARRALPNGPWEKIVFSDYGPISHTDVHNVNVIGICPEDGTIHLSFDHHVSGLHYRRSLPNVANNPASYTWTQSLFGSTTSALVPGNSLGSVSYPQFFATPQGKLQFCYRTGISGDGDWHFYEYSSSGWQRLGMLFSRAGTYGGKTSRCAYPNQFRYDDRGRLHITWSWREQGSDLRGNHDLGYVYSDDFGRTWRNNAGAVSALLNGAAGSANAVTVNTPGHIAYPVKYNWGYMNTTTQAVDSHGRVHVIAWRNPDSAPASTVDLNQWRYFHYWRDDSGAWHEQLLPFYGRKPQVVFDGRGNMYVVFGQGTNLNYHGADPGVHLAIATATEASGWTDWIIVSEVTGRQYAGEPLLDIGRWERERILSVYFQEKPAIAGSASSLRALDFRPKSERELWNEEQFGDSAGDPAIAGDGSNPSGDGIVNLLKYAFGIEVADPAGARLLPASEYVEVNGESYLAISFRRRTSPFAEVSYEVMGSEDLVNWVPVDVAGHLVGEPENLEGGIERVRVRAPASLSSRPRYFLKVKVTSPSP